MLDNILNNIDYSELDTMDENTNNIENAPITIPETTVPVSNIKAKIQGVGTVTPANPTVYAKAESETRLVDGRSGEILTTLQSLVHGIKAANDYAATVVSNQKYILERFDIVLTALGKEGVDFEAETAEFRKEIRESAELIRQATLLANPAVTAQQPSAKKTVKKKTEKKKPTHSEVILRTLYSQSERCMEKSKLIATVKNSIANPYVPYKTLETAQLIRTNEEGLTLLTEAGIKAVEKLLGDEAEEIVKSAQEADPDNMTFSTPADNNPAVSDNSLASVPITEL